MYYCSICSTSSTYTILQQVVYTSTVLLVLVVLSFGKFKLTTMRAFDVHIQNGPCAPAKPALAAGSCSSRLRTSMQKSAVPPPARRISPRSSRPCACAGRDSLHPMHGEAASSVHVPPCVPTMRAQVPKSRVGQDCERGTVSTVQCCSLLVCL